MSRATLPRSSMIDAMESSTDWNWVPAYTDPNQGDTAFFAPWQGSDGERGFTLDPKMLHHDRPTSYYFGTRKIGDPQFRGEGDAPLDRFPGGVATRKTDDSTRHRLPGEYGQEFSADVLPV